MDIYQLMPKGEMLVHNIHAPSNPAWKVVFFLNRRGAATKEQILNNVPDASWHTLNKLRRKQIIALVGRKVEV